MDDDCCFEDTWPHDFGDFEDGSKLLESSLFSWFSSFPGVSKEAFGRLLFLLSNIILPNKNNLVPTACSKERGLSTISSMCCCQSFTMPTHARN